MKYTVSAREPMYFPLGKFNTLKEAKEKANKSLKHHSLIEIYVCDDEDKEILDILTFKRA